MSSEGSGRRKTRGLFFAVLLVAVIGGLWITTRNDWVDCAIEFRGNTEELSVEIFQGDERVAVLHVPRIVESHRWEGRLPEENLRMMLVSRLGEAKRQVLVSEGALITVNVSFVPDVE